MEKKSENSNVIIISGAESTGKTELAQQLASYYSCNWVPELSRQYVEDLNCSYNYSDVEQIAKMQIERLNLALLKNERVIFDTGLIITKVWMQVVFNKCPNWLVEAIKSMPKIYHLVCDVDLPWMPDSVRENGGEMRNKLHVIYQNELSYFNLPFDIVSGTGNQRLENAVRSVNKFVKLL